MLEYIVLAEERCARGVVSGEVGFEVDVEAACVGWDLGWGRWEGGRRRTRPCPADQASRTQMVASPSRADAFQTGSLNPPLNKFNASLYLHHSLAQTHVRSEETHQTVASSVLPANKNRSPNTLNNLP